MKNFTAADAKNRFGQVLDAAQREPVTITKQGRASVVIISVADYERGRQRGWKNLLRTMEETGRYAVDQGLTPERLDELLADES